MTKQNAARGLIVALLKHIGHNAPIWKGETPEERGVYDKLITDEKTVIGITTTVDVQTLRELAVDYIDSNGAPVWGPKVVAAYPEGFVDGTVSDSFHPAVIKELEFRLTGKDHR